MPKQKHRICQHSSGSVKMQRLYVRVNSRFIPVGWRCPDCAQVQRD
jgi:ribosomal protein S27E